MIEITYDTATGITVNFSASFDKEGWSYSDATDAVFLIKHKEEDSRADAVFDKDVAGGVLFDHTAGSVTAPIDYADYPGKLEPGTYFLCVGLIIPTQGHTRPLVLKLKTDKISIVPNCLN